MIKKMFLFVFGLVAITTVALAQTQVAGKVTDEKGSPIDGVTITEKGTNNATATDINGMFKLKLKTQNAKLVFSLQGFTKKEVAVSENMVIKLTPANEELTQVVVTALGIKKEKKSLGTSVSSVNKKDLELNPQVDIARILSGKAPGLNILAASGLAGSGTNINIRGISTINGNSQPLFVVDGVPFDAGTNNNTSFTFGNNQTSRFFDIDPNNIENIEVLKSLAATTLYGEAGVNGVILITTKSGTGGKGAKKKNEITISHSYNVSQVASLPEYNQTYGGGFDLSIGLTFFSNWGGKFNNPPTLVPHPIGASYPLAFPEFVGKQYELKYYNSVPRFFRDGNSQTTSINISGGSKEASFSANYSYLEDEGFIIGNGTRRNNFGFGGNVKLSNKFTLNGTVNFVKSDVKSPPTSVSFGSNPTNSSVFGNVLYTPTGVDLIGLPYQNPLDGSSVYYRGDIQNPRWTLNNAFTRNETDRIYGTAQLKYDFSNDLNIFYRIGFDNYTENTLYAQNKGGVQSPLGIYRTRARTNFIWDHTIFGQFKKSINEEIGFNVDFGYNLRINGYKQNGILSTEQLVFGILDHTNFISHDVVDEAGADLDRKFKASSIGYFAAFTVDYNQYVFLNFGGRYSTSSRLEPKNNSIFYPNASISVVLTEAIKALKSNKNINYLKLRFGYGTAANFPSDEYPTRQNLNITTRSLVERNGTVLNSNGSFNRLANSELKPELQTDLELGIDGKFFNNLINTEISFYQKIAKDQILQQNIDPAAGYTNRLINAGNVTNKGFEILLGANVIRHKDWNLKFEYLHSLNVSLVSDIPSSIKYIIYSGYTGSAPGNTAVNGSQLGVIYGNRVKRYTGHPDPNDKTKTIVVPEAVGKWIVNSSGDYLVDQEIGQIGDPNPKYRSTLITTLSWKQLTFRMQWEYTEGGDMYSLTATSLLARGVTKDTEFDRAAPVILPGVTEDGKPNNYQISATQAFFNTGVGDAGERAVYDATVIRLRELSLSYSLPNKLLSKTPFGSASIVINGSNLWYYAPNFPKYINFDPETSSLGVGNGKGLELFSGPTSRRYGISLRLTF